MFWVSMTEGLRFFYPNGFDRRRKRKHHFYVPARTRFAGESEKIIRPHLCAAAKQEPC
jgi:hypothetical protein